MYKFENVFENIESFKKFILEIFNKFSNIKNFLKFLLLLSLLLAETWVVLHTLQIFRRGTFFLFFGNAFGVYI